MDAPSKNYQDMVKTIEGYSNQQIQSIWDTIKKYDPSRQFSPGIRMDQWVSGLYSEMKKRKMPCVKKTGK